MKITAQLGNKKTIYLLIFLGLCLLMLIPKVSPGLALLLGLLTVALRLQQPLLTKKSGLLLKLAIVLMGFGLPIDAVVKSSQTTFWLTISSMTVIFLLGGALLYYSRYYGVLDKKVGGLVMVGTAICGGSAIATMAPIVGADNRQTALALMIVFSLNAVALYLFPLIGQGLDFSPDLFAYWAGVAIHDTSSVVGAAASYSNESLAVAIAVKLSRVIWIIPIAFVAAILIRQRALHKAKIDPLVNDDSLVKPKIVFPWFILLFVLASIIHSQFPAQSSTWGLLSQVGKQFMILALFLIGASLRFAELKKGSLRAFYFAITLWICVALFTLWYLLKIF